jgi:hypothetical protein
MLTPSRNSSTPDCKKFSIYFQSNPDMAGAMTVAAGSASRMPRAVARASVVYFVASGLGRQNSPFGSL